jgi:amidase
LLTGRPGPQSAEDLLFRPATELADLVRKGELSARELVDASLARIDAVDGRVNAFTLVDADGARAAADQIGPGDERPFAGVPIGIKDLAAPVAGLVMSDGSELYGDYTPDYDSYVVRRVKEAGFVIVGKTNSPELGIVPVTEPRRFGPTRNPWNLDVTPGGSSGGSGAAVAAGMVPIAHGSDGGGSIRIPAACCGLVGLKPSRGRVSRGPDLGDAVLSTDGMLTRTVEDCARSLDVIAGYEPGDATWAPPPQAPFASALGRDPGKLSIGLITKPPIEAEVDPICERAARDAGELLAGLGHDVSEVDPPWGGDTEHNLLQLFTVLYAANIGLGVAYGGVVSGREPRPEHV